MNMTLTNVYYPNRTQEIYRFIVQHKRAHDGNSPSIREIMAACQINSSSVVKSHLDTLANQGLIQRVKHRSVIEVIGGQWKFNGVRVRGGGR